HTRFSRDWSSDVCSSDLAAAEPGAGRVTSAARRPSADALTGSAGVAGVLGRGRADPGAVGVAGRPLAADLVLAGGAGADEDRGADRKGGGEGGRGGDGRR